MGQDAAETPASPGLSMTMVESARSEVPQRLKTYNVSNAICPLIFQVSRGFGAIRGDKRANSVS